LYKGSCLLLFAKKMIDSKLGRHWVLATVIIGWQDLKKRGINSWCIDYFLYLYACLQQNLI
jgi:hypothetical protein